MNKGINVTLVDNMKRSISNLLYNLGFKVNFDYTPIKELVSTKDLKLQLKNLTSLKSKIYKIHKHYQKKEWKGLFSDKKFSQPSLELVSVNDEGLLHYALVWRNETLSKSVRIKYREDGLLCWIAVNHQEGNKVLACGVGIGDICDYIWAINE